MNGHPIAGSEGMKHFFKETTGPVNKMVSLEIKHEMYLLKKVQIDIEIFRGGEQLEFSLKLAKGVYEKISSFEHKRFS